MRAVRILFALRAARPGALVLATLTGAACTGAPGPTPAPSLAPTCSAAADLPAWLNPSPRADGRDALPTAAGDDDCAVNKFAWQDLLAIVRPAESGGPAAFERWPEKSAVLGVDNMTRPLGGLPEGALIDFVEAGPTANPLVDRNGQWVYYETRVSPTEAWFVQGCGLTRPDCTRALTEVIDWKALPMALPTGNARIRFPDESVETKAAWKVMGPGDDIRRFYTRSAVVAPAEAGTRAEATVTVGLVGLHIVHLTRDQRAWVWATFEHVDNAPDCDDTAGLLAAGTSDTHYNFFDAGCAAACAGDTNCVTRCGELNVYQNNGCPVDTKGDTVPTSAIIAPSLCGAALDQTCLTSTGCFQALDANSHSGGYYGGANCFYADASLTVAQIVESRLAGGDACRTAVPTQLCRAYPVGWRGVSSDGSAVVPLMDPTLAPLNEELRAALATQDAEWARVWANYRLVGVQWGAPTEGNYAFDPIGSSEIVVKGDPALANLTMEAYIQGHDIQKSVKVPKDMADALAKGTFQSGCLGCHGTVYAQFAEGSFAGANFTPWRQAHFSHVLDYLALAEGDGDAAACLAAQADARATLAADPPDAAWKRAILDACPVPERAAATPATPAPG